MTPRSASTRHALEACTLQLHAWKPFDPSKPYHLHAKKPCRSDRSTAPDTLDLSRLSLLDDPSTPTPPPPDGFRWFRKRRRRGSRSVSGRSSDRSVNRRRGGGGAPSAAYATCSDFPLPAGGTDSSGEMFANGDGGSWGSDASEARVTKEAVGGGVSGLERDSAGSGTYQGGGAAGVVDAQGFESGYGSEPGYRGDVVFGYGDEFDEEDDDGRVMFWGERFVGGLGGKNMIDVICSSPVEIVTGPIAGEILVEDVGIGGSEQSDPLEHRRRMRFKRMPNLVQTQVRLLPDTVDPKLLRPEVGSLVQPYLAPMAASLSLIAPHIGRGRPRALCIGVGGGALPMFLELKLGFDVVGVEADDVVLSLARRHFGLVEGEFINVFVGDGIELVKRFAETDAGGFDVVMVDLDEADAASGMSAPPLEFVEKSVLLAARTLLRKHGLLVVNVIPQGEGFYKGLVDSFREIFGELHELEVGNEENYVLIASNYVYGSDVRAGGGDFCSKLKRVIGEGYIDKIRRL